MKQLNQIAEFNVMLDAVFATGWEIILIKQSNEPNVLKSFFIIMLKDRLLGGV